MEQPISTINRARWSFFLRALAQEVDAYGGPEGRDVLLRGIGKRLATMLPLPEVSSLEAFELEINAVLADLGWGRCALALDKGERCIVISHTGMPVIGSNGEPAGAWLVAALEGLYGAWLMNHPDCGDGFSIRRQSVEAGGDIVLNFQCQQ
ncbi:MAG TPA: cellulose biosynthesis protein BcsD [Rhodopila sp.]|nr:cellulose biosynthesis protein BcsD [Rhodopila sp.]